MCLYITAREREIIHLILQHEDGITVSEIAKHVGVSQRTIHRELNHVATIITKHGMTLKKKAGVGLFLQGTRQERNELKISLLKQATEFSAKEREELILMTLLKSTEVIKLIALANDFKVTKDVISKDLANVAAYLKSFGITLLRKKGHGISLVATEEQKRNALGYFLAKQFNEYEFLEALKDPVEHQNKFLEIIKIEKLTLSEKLIREMMAQHDLQLTDHAHMTLTIHLSFIIERIILGELITIDETLLKELKNDEKYTIALEIASVIEDVFNIEIPEAELGYITIHLKGARLNSSMLKRTGEPSVHESECRSLISYVAQKLNVPFEKDATILEGLLKHIEPAIYRLERSIDLYNPLALQIMTEYPRLFAATKEGLEICFPQFKFSDGEIAYIVLYFGSSYLLYDVKKEIKLAVICPSGLGSSKMLAHRIEKAIDGLADVTTFSVGDLKLQELSTFDVVLSTVELTEYSDNYLLVSPILTDVEIDQIQRIIKPHTRTTEDVLLERVHLKDKKEEFQFDIKEEFQKINRYSELALYLLATFDVYHLNIDDKEQKLVDKIVLMMLHIMYEKRLITDIFGVQVDLKKRGLLGGFGIPETQVAFYHCLTDSVKKPVFSVFRLDKAIKVDAMDKKAVDITSILVVLAPTSATEIELEILSSISTVVIEDVGTTEVFTTGSKEMIEETLSRAFYQKFKLLVKM